MEEDRFYPQVRKLKLKDRKTLTKLISVFIDKSGNTGLKQMVPKFVSSDDDKDDVKDNDAIYNTIRVIIQGIIEFADEEFAVWLMDLIGCETIEDFEDMEFDIEVYIIDELLSRKGFTNFFLKAYQLYKKTIG